MKVKVTARSDRMQKFDTLYLFIGFKNLSKILVCDRIRHADGFKIIVRLSYLVTRLIMNTDRPTISSK